MTMSIVILGLSITSSWGNGHATTFRGLARALAERGHRVLFLERDVPWYASNRDAVSLPFCRVALYGGLSELRETFGKEIREADLVVVGSFVPEGVAVGQWVTGVARGVKAFYDIDTPVTMEKLRIGDFEYLRPELIPCYDVYLSFTGGPFLNFIERTYKARSALPLYCSVDPSSYYPETQGLKWHLGYIGTYSDDRQPSLETLLLRPAGSWHNGRFVVAGPKYPARIDWPSNVDRLEHVPPAEHRRFYNSQMLTLNITREDMIRAGYSPSVRLFEAAACAVPVISDRWAGLEAFFMPGKEILTAGTTAEVVHILRYMPREQIEEIGLRARRKVLSAHTAGHRAAELEGYVMGNQAGGAGQDLIKAGRQRAAEVGDGGNRR